MAILCSQCGVQVPRPDVSRGTIVCARCATLRSPPDEDDMGTIDHPPPPHRDMKPPPGAGRNATMPAPPPVAPARPSMIPRPVGGPPGQRIPAGGAPRATPSVAPRAATTPPPKASYPPPPASAQPFALKPSTRPQPKQSVPPPRMAPNAEPRAPVHAPVRAPVSASDEPMPEDFAPLETGDFELVSHTPEPRDFESTPDKKPLPQKPPRP